MSNSSTRYTFLKQNIRSVERFKVTNLCSGTTVWRCGLVIIGLLSFFSVSLYISSRLSNLGNDSLSFVDNQYFFAYYISLSAFSFAMIPLCDFQIFPYNHKFWDLFKSLGTYVFLVETEGIGHFIAHFEHIHDWTEFDDQEYTVMWDFIMLSLVRWCVLACFVFKGYMVLRSIIQLRNLASNFYVSLYSNLFEFTVFHAFGSMLAWSGYHMTAVLLIVATLMHVYFIFRYCIFYVNYNYDDDDYESRKRYSKLSS